MITAPPPLQHRIQTRAAGLPHASAHACGDDLIVTASLLDRRRFIGIGAPAAKALPARRAST